MSILMPFNLGPRKSGCPALPGFGCYVVANQLPSSGFVTSIKLSIKGPSPHIKKDLLPENLKVAIDPSSLSSITTSSSCSSNILQISVEKFWQESILREPVHVEKLYGVLTINRLLTPFVSPPNSNAYEDFENRQLSRNNPIIIFILII